MASFLNLEHEDMNYWRPWLHLHRAVCNSDALEKELDHSFVDYAVGTFDLVPYSVLVPSDGDDSLDTCHAFVRHAFVMLDKVTSAALDTYALSSD